MEALRPGAIGHEFKQAGGLAACNSKRSRHLRRIQAEQRAGGRSGAQRAGGAGRMEAAPVRYCRLERGGNPAGNLEPGDDGFEKALAAGAALLRQRQCRGKDKRFVMD